MESHKMIKNDQGIRKNYWTQRPGEISTHMENETNRCQHWEDTYVGIIWKKINADIIKEVHKQIWTLLKPVKEWKL